ncbi:MAG: hypothetical protein FWD67_07525 [Betaproteobacteria bacterium]|nr:hypothetical protein [Betaproteobacteria bacterium]
MKMKKPIFLLSAAVTALLAACMTPPPRSGDYMVSNQQIILEESDRIQALRDAGKTFSHIVTVPSADDMLSILSNSVAIGVLKMNSSSGPADSLLGILRKGDEQAVAVVGKSDALTVATIEAAIRQLNGNPTATAILFAGDPDYVKQLQESTGKAGVPFEGIPFPNHEEK